jgi:polyphosphate:AMP phosphotransferase
MFESAELGQKVDKETYRSEEPQLRAALLRAQAELAEANFSVLIMIAGVPAAGKAETVNLLLEWLDARGVQTHADHRPTDEERQRPHLWRFWRQLPPHGHIGIFFGAWDQEVFLDHVFGRISQAEYDRLIQPAIDLERMLARENTLLVKFWLHLAYKDQKKRLRKLRKDPLQSWRVTKLDRRLLRHYDSLRSAAEHLLRRTSTAEAPWHVIEAADRRYRNLTVARTLLDALRSRLETARGAPRVQPQPVTLTPPPVNVINTLDQSHSLEPAVYEQQLARWQGELGQLTQRLYRSQRSMILVFEGPDAAGKGGTIRRLIQAMDARDYRVISISAPTDEERAHPYLWRFWRHLPGHGHVTIYDRSWYGRVLVERIEGFAREEEWRRAYEEINSFESQLVDFGIVLVKFWLAITPEEQLQRFRDREETPYKQYKLTPEDWRNRSRWDSYEAAACEMIAKTSTETTPWVLIEANNKEWARIKTLRTVVERLGKALE